MIEVRTRVDGDLGKDVWAMYHDAFEQLNALAVQRHLMHRSEFDDVMTDERISKYLCRNDRGALIGISTFTNVLSAMPLISPEYFERRWPQQYARRAIWYCGFVAVHAGHRGSAAFMEMVSAMYRCAEQDEGVIGLDICRHNEEAYRLATAVRLLLHRTSDGRCRTELTDTQSFWTYNTTGSEVGV